MSKALGISGFAFHNAAETERLTKPDCSKFHTMELHFLCLTHQHCHSVRPGHCLFWGSEQGEGSKTLRHLDREQWLAADHQVVIQAELKGGCHRNVSAYHSHHQGRTMLCNQVYNMVTLWHQPPLNWLTSPTNTKFRSWCGHSFHSTLPFTSHTHTHTHAHTHTHTLNWKIVPHWTTASFQLSANLSKVRSFKMVVYSKCV